jgi:hypothetical protein
MMGKGNLPVVMTLSRKWLVCLAVQAFLVLLSLCLSGCSTARQVPIELAKKYEMTLSDHEFAAVDFVPQAGDIITIHNRSDISHSIYVTYPNGEMVNLGVQTPGTEVHWKVPVDAKGEFVFQCWIHPIIRARFFINAGKVSSAISEPISTATRQELFNGQQNICSSNRRT